MFIQPFGWWSVLVALLSPGSKSLVLFISGNLSPKGKAREDCKLCSENAAPTDITDAIVPQHYTNHKQSPKPPENPSDVLWWIADRFFLYKRVNILLFKPPILKPPPNLSLLLPRLCQWSLPMPCKAYLAPVIDGLSLPLQPLFPLRHSLRRTAWPCPPLPPSSLHAIPCLSITGSRPAA